MQEEQFHELGSEELRDAMGDLVEGMSEEAFDPSALDGYLDALDAREGGLGAWAAGHTEQAFRARHPELFPERRKARRPWRLAGRIVAVAAAAGLGGALVCQAMGIPVFSFLGKWGREQFWFPDETVQIQAAGDAVLRTGPYESLEEALEENGVTVPMTPAWTPEPGERFGKLRATVEVSREFQSDLFTADWRDGEGRGYLVEVVRSDAGIASLMLDLERTQTVEYVCDGVTYYISEGRDGGQTTVSWARDGLRGTIRGDLDQETAQRLACSITRQDGKMVGRADPARKPGLGNDLVSMLEVSGLNGDLAPKWIPEGYVLTDIQSSWAMPDVTMVRASYDDPALEKSLTVHIEWWQEPEKPVVPVFERDGYGRAEYEHQGVLFSILDDGPGKIIAWQTGHVSGYISGGLTADEARKVIDSIPHWDDERPEPDQSGIQMIQPDVTAYASLAEALEAHGMDPAMAPAWIPEGYVLDEATVTALHSETDFFAAYQKGEDCLMVSIGRMEKDLESQGVAVYEKDSEPVEEYVHNGITYYLMSNNGYRTAAWKTEGLEGFLGGPLTLDELKQIVDSIGYGAE